MNMFNHCIASNDIPKAWRKAKIIALLKPGKDPSILRNHRPYLLTLPHLQTLWTFDSGPCGPLCWWSPHFRTGRFQARKVLHWSAPKFVSVHWRWFWEGRNHRSCFCWPIGSLRYSQPQNTCQETIWMHTWSQIDEVDSKFARKLEILCHLRRKEESVEKAKMAFPRKRSCPFVFQHLHKRSAHLTRYQKFSICGWFSFIYCNSIEIKHNFLHCVNALDTQPHNRRVSMWQEHLAGKPNNLTITPQESLPPGSSEMWLSGSA